MDKPYITIYKHGDYANYCVNLKDKLNAKHRSISGISTVIKVKHDYPNIPIYDISNVDKILTRNALYFRDRVR